MIPTLKSCLGGIFVGCAAGRLEAEHLRTPGEMPVFGITSGVCKAQASAPRSSTRHRLLEEQSRAKLKLPHNQPLEASRHYAQIF